jgi:tRNA(Leu) C34 or U34 (ribose-2'-O)-methylase TrmL
MRGYFFIGIYQPKTAENVGTLWRSAYQLGAAGIFTIGRRYNGQCSDTCKAERHIPLFNYETFEQFQATRPYAAPLVAVEFGGVALEQFRHPQQAIYMLGSEDSGLPDFIIQAAQHHVQLSSVRQPSYNVAVTGSVVMYHRSFLESSSGCLNWYPDSVGGV